MYSLKRTKMKIKFNFSPPTAKSMELEEHTDDMIINDRHNHSKDVPRTHTCTHSFLLIYSLQFTSMVNLVIFTQKLILLTIFFQWEFLIMYCYCK